MFLKWIFFFGVLNFMNANSDARWDFPYDPLDGSDYHYAQRSCMSPHLDHGRVRMRSNRRLVRFSCFSGYELVGNKYATCHLGQWDTPKPMCVKPGCPAVSIKNGFPMATINGAWLVFFCLPGYQLSGSPVLFCDGNKWNGTSPTCVANNTKTKLSCDFESADMCGWTQDNLHDFDWERMNMKTPSGYFKTGPSYDHTFGKDKDGYYMYIESSARKPNDTARLVSPVYDVNLSKDNCFVFYYHMYGRYIGGLRVYQKPDSVSTFTGGQYLDDKYLLFEQWGNQGDVWWGSLSPLKDYGEDFQIVIEGIRGKSFISDIAIDDVAILPSENCTELKKTMKQPYSISTLSQSCEGRCGESSDSGCSCSWNCWDNSNCCADIYEICGDGESDSIMPLESTTTSEEPPQTEKLIAKSTPSTTMATTPEETIQVQNPTIEPPSRVLPVQPPTTTSEKPLTSRNVFRTSTYSTTSSKATTQKFDEEISTTDSEDTTPSEMTTDVPAYIKSTRSKYYSRLPWVHDEKKEPSQARNSDDGKEKSSAWKPILITLAVVLCCAGAVLMLMRSRGVRMTAAIAILRGRATHDPEVRYLHSETDD